METEQKDKWRILKRIGLGLVLFVVLLFSGLVLFLNSSTVQTKVINGSSQFLKDKLGLTVSVGNIDFQPFNKIHIQRLLLAKEGLDTMLYLSDATVAINVNPIKLIRKEITFSSVKADSVVFRGIFNYSKEKLSGNMGLTEENKDPMRFLFSPCEIDVSYFNLNFKDTVTKFDIDVITDQISGEVTSANFSDQYALKNMVITRPDVTIYGAKQTAGDHPIISLLLAEIQAEKDSIAIANNIVDTEEKKHIFWFFDLDVDDLEIIDGRLNVFNWNTDIADYNHTVHFKEINGSLGKGDSDENHVLAKDFSVWFNIADSVTIKQASFGNLELEETKLTVNDVHFNVLQSYVSGDLVFDFTKIQNFLDFQNLVNWQADLPEGQIHMVDIATLFPSLADNEAMQGNLEKVYQAEFKLRGTLNDFTAEEWKLSDDGLLLGGGFHIKNVLSELPNRYTFNFKKTSIPSWYLKKNLSFIDFPLGLDSLVNIGIYGSVDVNGNRLVSDLTAKTALGIVHNRTELNLKSIKYNTEFGLKNFDIGTFFANPDLGRVSLTANLNEGESFNLNQMTAFIQGRVDSIYFKGYTYKDFVLNGRVENNRFNGSLGMDKEELDFVLNGIIDFSAIPRINVLGRINNAQLDELNLSDVRVALSGNVDVDLIVMPIDSLSGYARLNNFILTREDSIDFHMNEITFDAKSWGNNFKDWKLRSDILSINIDGQFNMENILSTTYEILKSRHPQIISYFPDVNLSSDTIYSNDFTMVIDVNDTQEFSHLINAKLDTIHDLNLSLTYRNRGRENFEYYFQASAPKIQFDKNIIEALNINASGSKTDNEWIVYADNFHSGNLFVDSLQLNAKLIGDQLGFKLETKSINNIVDRFYIAGSNEFQADKNFELGIDSSSFELLKREWMLNQENSISVGKGRLFVDNLVFTSGDRNLYVQSATDESMVAGVRNVDIQFLDRFFPNGKFKFSGSGDVVIGVENIFNLTGLEVETIVQDMVINNENFGTFTTLFYTLGLQQMANVSMNFENKGKKTMIAKGAYDIFNKDENKIPIFDFDIQANQFPILVLEFLMSDIINQTSGYVNASVTLESDGQQADIGGRALINGKTTIPLLGTEYKFINSGVDLSNDLIDFDDINMVDSEGNLADVSGGIRHDHLTNFRMDTRVSSDKFLLLNTQNTEGALFYGRGLGKASLHISGPFTQLNMDVQARTGPTSHISIPISSTISVDRNEDFFINFISNNTFEEYDNIKVDNGRFKIEGLKLNLDLTLTEDCEVSIILDESSGDILRSRGFSELHMEMSRSGNFTMQGTYEVISGQYLFAQLNFTRKSFKINRGGTITWNGDPLDAKIDLDASYSVRTPPYNFIIEYLNVSDDRLQELAQNATPVDLFLHLSGDLFSPEINFNIEFPELSGQIKNYVEDRMRVLKDDQNEINKQVFGLLIARSFIPSVSSVVNIDGTVVNTVSEVLTNQLSFFITEYLQSSLDDVAFISDIELNVGYNVYRNSYERDVNTGVKTGNEIILQPEFGFLDNRLRIRTEANLLTGSAFNANTLITHDFVIEYAITEDHRLKANLYQRTEPYRTEKNAKFGVGLSYRKEFDSFYNFIFGSRSKSEL